MVGTLRGHAIYLDGEDYRYVDNDEPVLDTWADRDCGHCKRHTGPDGHDPCIGELPGVMNACCGHGCTAEAYVQFESGERLAGEDALAMMGRAS